MSRRRGRPRVDAEDGPSDRMTVTLPADLQDKACLYALRRGVSVGQVIREALEAELARHELTPAVVERRGRL